MKWIDLSQVEREAALNTVAVRYGIDMPSVEKDWWVTAVLQLDAFRTDYANMVNTFIFKEAPSFDLLMQRISELEQRFRDMK